MHILLTGGTGFIGRTLAPLLIAQPDTAVTLLLRDDYKGQPLPPLLENLRPKIDLVYIDLSDYLRTARTVYERQPDQVIHLAAVGVSDPFLPVKTALAFNLHATLNLLHACFEKSSTTHKFIIGRTPGEHSAMNPYATSKAAAWQFCRMYVRTQQWPIIGAMIYQAYGPGQPENNLVPAAIKAAHTQVDFPMTAGTQERDWVYISDVAAGILTMLHADLMPGTTVDIGTGQLNSVANVVCNIYEIIGGNGRPQIGAIQSRPGEMSQQLANTARTKELIDWQATTSLDQGLNKTCQHYQATFR